MPKPWEKYEQQQTEQAQRGPWDKYATTESEAVAKGGLWNLLAGPELFLSALSSAAVEPVAGLAGIGAAIVPGGKTGAEMVESMRGRAYQPQTELAQGAQKFMGDTIGKYAEGMDWLGEKAAEKTGSPAVGAAVQTAGMMAPAAIPAVGSGVRRGVGAVKQQFRHPIVQKAGDLGYTLEPTQVMGGSRVGGPVKQAAAASGKYATTANASVKNQAVTNRLVAKEIGSPDPNMITRGHIQELRQKAYNTYTKIKASKPKMQVQNDPQFVQAIDDAIFDATDAFTGQKPPGAVMKQLEGLKNPRGVQSVAAAMDKIEKLRRDARTLFKSDDPEKLALARASRSAADALEDAVGRALEKSAPELLPEYQAARQQLAKLHNVEDAWVNGDIDAVKLAKLRANGAPLTGKLAEIADMADYFPHVMKSGATQGRTANLGAIDWALAAPTLGLWPAAKLGAQAYAPVSPPYKPPPFANQLISGEVIGSQFSRYRDGNN